MAGALSIGSPPGPGHLPDKETMSIVLVVDKYLPRSPNASARKHWGHKVEERKFWEMALGHQAWLAGVAPASGKRSVRYELERKGGVKLRDKDNLNASVKHCQDALVNLGLLIDDDDQWLEWLGVGETNGLKQTRTLIILEDV